MESVNNSITISSVITYYRGENFISKLLCSLRQAISYSTSSGVPFIHRTIVVDDSELQESHDALLEAIESSGISDHSEILVIRNPRNVGVTLSRKQGISCVREDYFNIIDQDDLVSEGLFVSVVECSQIIDQMHIMMFGADIIDSNGKQTHNTLLFGSKGYCRKVAKKSSKVSTLVYGGNPIKSPGMLVFQREAVTPLCDCLDLVNRDVDGSDDYLMYLYLLKAGFGFFHCGKIGLYYRLHDSNQSKTIGIRFTERASKGIEALRNARILSDDEARSIYNRYSLINRLSQTKSRFSRLITMLKTPCVAARYWKYRI